MKSIPAYFADTAEAAPESVYLCRSDGWQVTYGEAAETIAAGCRALEELGLRPGDRVICYVEDAAPLAQFYLSCMLSRILPVLHAYDHPARDVHVEIWLVRASGSRVSPPMASPGIPPELLRSLSDHLQYQTYDLLADSRVRGREGERVTFDLGNDYMVRFRLGTVVSQRLRLNEFEVLLEREGELPASLVRSHLNLWLGRTMVLALAAGEASPTALMVIVRCELESAAIVQGRQ